MSARKIVVEAIIPAPVELVWERSQTPELHVQWDIRFNQIDYLDKLDARGFQLMDYGYEHRVWDQGLGHRTLPSQRSSLSLDFRI